MKKLFILFITASFVAACNNNNPFARKDQNADKSDQEKKGDPEKKEGNGNVDYSDKDKNYTGNNWSRKQTDEWRDDCLSEYRDEPNAKQMCECMIDKISQKFPDENDAKKADEDELDQLIEDCEARFKNNNNDNGGYIRTDRTDDYIQDNNNRSSWTDLQRQQYIRDCESTAAKNQSYTAQQINSYCDCMTRKVERKYSFPDAAKLTTADFQTQEWRDAAADCTPHQ